VIDLFVGTAIAMGCMIIGPRLYRRWNPEDGKEKLEDGKWIIENGSTR
jgi:hypothetical protein